MPRRSVRCVLLALLAGAAPSLAHAQHRGELGLLAGPSPYDLSGTGTGFAAKATLTLDPGLRAIAIEPGLGYFRYTDQGGATVTYLLPEVSVQLRAHSGAIRPYLGAGAGLARASAAGASATDLTLHGALGLRVPLSSNWSLRAEARLRSVDPFTGNMMDLGFGIGRLVF